jgi:hypothetical protein
LTFNCFKKRNLFILRALCASARTCLFLFLAFSVAASSLALKSELFYSCDMSSVREIETAVSRLSRQELLAFRDWFSGFDAAAWDKQFEEDVAAGHSDALADEAIRDLREGRCRDL